MGSDEATSRVGNTTQETATQSKLNYSQVIVLCIVNFNEALQGNVIWPFVPFAVQRWGASEDDVGIYVGVLASSFFFAQLLTVGLWGKASDVFGRRPTLLFGLLGTGLSMALFGFARSFPVALLARFLTGALNGNVAIAKTYMGEICDQNTISRGFSWLSFCWGLGSIVAPTIGGYLAEPAENYEAFREVAFFKTFPYVLPALVSVLFSTFAVVLGYFQLPETDVFLRGAHQRKAGANTMGSRDEHESSASEITRTPGRTLVQPSESELQEVTQIESSDQMRAERCASMEVESDHKANAKVWTPSLEHLQRPKEEASRSEITASRDSEQAAPTDDDGDEEEVTKDEDTALLVEPDVDANSEPGAETSFLGLLRNSAVRSSVICYCLLASAQIIFDELLPVLLQTSLLQGGFAFSSNQVGSVQIVAGITQVTFQLLVFPYINHRFGPLMCFRHAMWPLVVLIFFPAVARLQDQPTLAWCLLSVGVVCKTGFMTVAFTSIMIAINNSSRGINLGLVNGFAQTTVSFVRTVGPAIGGGVFAGSLHWEALGAFRLHVVYILLAFFCFLAFVCSYRLPTWVNTAPRFGKVIPVAD